MKVSEFAEKYLGVKLRTYQKIIIDKQDNICSKCDVRHVCKAYGGYCDKWKKLKSRENWLDLLERKVVKAND